MKKKIILLISLLSLTSCNDPMFFEGKKATEEEVNAFISNISDNRTFLKPGWYEYNCEQISSSIHKDNDNNKYNIVNKFVYNIKVLVDKSSTSNKLELKKIVGTQKRYDLNVSDSNSLYVTYEYYGIGNEIFILIKDERTNEIQTIGSEKYNFLFTPKFFETYDKYHENSYIKENSIHFKFCIEEEGIISNKDLAFSYDDKYNLNKGKYKIDLKYLYNDDWCTLKSVETIEPCEEQTFEVRKDYEEETIWKYLII